MTSRTHILLIDVHDEKDGTKEGFCLLPSMRQRVKNVCCATRSVDIKHIIAFNENHSPFFCCFLIRLDVLCWTPYVRYREYICLTERKEANKKNSHRASMLPGRDIQKE